MTVQVTALRGGFAPASLKPPCAACIVPCSRQPLRGGFAPASLKRLRPLPLRTQLQYSPGRIRPGLIEASFASVVFVMGCMVSPGRIRPGLIEARPCSLARSPRAHPLRGGFAPASLKHVAYRGRHPMRCHGALRGGFAPASLKLGIDIGPVVHAADSPGRIRPGLIEARLRTDCPASLKHGSGVAGWHEQRGSPGRIRPGLIEATCAGPGTRTG